MTTTSKLGFLFIAALAVAGCKKKDEATSAETPKAETPKAETPKETPPAETPKEEPGGEIETQEITYNAGDTVLKGFLAYPKGAENVPGVLIVHEWWGHNDYVRNRAKQLAGMGYAAFALDMYGDGKNTGHPKDAQKFMQEVMANMDEGEARFKAAKKLLEEQPMTDPEKIAAIGYCFGGAVVLHMARQGMDLDAVASFHGNLSTKTPAKKGAIKAKILVAHGAADPFAPPEQVEAFKKEMDAAGADYEFIAYEGAKHAFTNPAATEKGKEFNLPLEYNEKADKESWAALEKLLDEVF
jgi:dienelactone hydrolase